MTGHDKRIAIVGYACRLPSATNAGEFWNVLADGRCVVTEVQPERWSTTRFSHPDRNTAGRSYTFAAGQIDDVWGFDPGFFGISPREALQMDPQQRLLLQVTWEALEHAGIVPSSIAGTETGVFVGVSGLDHSNFFVADPAAMDIQMMTGNTLSIVSNRISYIFDLVGPSFTVDTACSSSLVALHQAAEAMRSGRIECAIVGGVNILLSPSSFIGFSRASMLSPTGLCRAFDADADGYVRSEGAVVVVLKTLDAAIAAGDRILGVIEGSGVNADGRTNGLSLPSADRQADLLRHIYSDFAIDPADLAFIEAHGTGTRVGDPAETKALGSVLGQRRDRVLPIGSVKTNIGHLEAASGLAGLLKAQLALEHGLLPPSLHLRTPNPDIAFDDLNLAVATAPLVLEKRPTPAMAGINSFGFGGANAHVVIRQPTAAEAAASGKPAGETVPMILTARTAESLSAGLVRLKAAVESAEDESAVAEMANALAWRRERHEHRIVLPARSRDGLLKRIDAAIGGADRIPNGRTLSDRRPVAFLFSGNGAQWPGMGRHMMATDATFRAAIHEVDALFEPLAGWSIVSALAADDLETRLERTEVSQPLLFAIQVGTTRALAARGLVPAAVSGHSVGEVAAVWASGAIDLQTAVRIIHARSVHQQRTQGFGSMAAVLIGADAAEAAIAEGGFETLSVAAVNSPRSITVSGSEEELTRFGKLAKGNRWAFRRLKLGYPFHSPLVEPIRDEMLADLADVTAATPAIPFFTTVAGHEDDNVAFDGLYWWDNVRRPVLFEPALRRMAEAGLRLFVEIGPKPILQTYVNDSLSESYQGTAVLASLDQSPSQSEVDADEIVGRVLVRGGVVDEVAYFGPRAALGVLPPHYAWNQADYRIPRTDEALDIFGRGRDHPLLGARLVAGSGPFLGELDPERVPYLVDHKVQSSVVFPAAGFVEMVIAAARAHGMDGPIEVSDFEVFSPLVFNDDQYDTRVEVQNDGGLVWIWTRRRLSGEDWRLNARASVSAAPKVDLDPPVLVNGDQRLTTEELYALTERFGLHYGPAFRTARVLRHVSDHGVVMGLGPAPDDDHHLHPTLLDGAFHGLLALIAGPLGDHVDGGTSYLPVRINRLQFVGDGSSIAGARVDLVRASPRSIQARIDLFDAAGGLVARLEGVRFKAVALNRSSEGDLVYANRLVRLADRPIAGRQPAQLDRSPAEVAKAIGAVCETAPEPAAGALLVDAAARRIAWDALSELFVDGRIDLDAAVASGRLAADAVPLASAMLGAIREDGAVEADVLVGECPYPDQRALISALVAEAPQRIAETMALAAVSSGLGRILNRGLAESAPIGGAVAEHLATSAPSIAPLAEALEAVGVATVAEWPADRPLSVLVVGGDAVALAVRLLETGKVGRVVASDPSNERCARLALTAVKRPRFAICPLSDLPEDQWFDLVLFLAEGPASRLALPTVAGRIGASGELILAAPYPTLFTDLVWGCGRGWWTSTFDSANPIGGRMHGREWEMALSELRFRKVSGATLNTAELAAGLYFAEMPRATPDRRSQTEQSVIVFADRIEAAAPISAEIVRKLRAAGRAVEVAVVDGDGQIRSLEGPDDRLMAILASPDGKDVIHLQQVDARADATHRIAERAMALRELLLQRLQAPARVWIVAPGGNLAHGGELDYSAAGIWGLGRVLMNECAAFDIRLIDIQGDGGVELFVEELVAPSDEKELLLDDRGRFGIRIEPVPMPVAGSDAEGDAGLVLESSRQGSLDGLDWVPQSRAALAEGEIEIAVAATGLNFRDVMWAQGLLPEEALEDGFAGATLGMECSGVVSRVGPGATRFAVGDRVLSFAPACFATHVRVSEKAVSALPASVDLEAAATIPVTFLTAYYALVELARLEAGEILLVHGGAGGVGLAALQIALSRGVRVFATAGSREKRRLLTLLGAEQVFDSRSLAFEAEVMAATGGAGVDAVLNSLNGEAMERSIRCLKPFGRFVELGKRDYYANTRIGLRPFRQNLSYFGVDADQLLAARPALTARLLKEILASFESGAYTPLPHRVFEGARVSDAFRLMQQSGHTGKILVRPPILAARTASDRPGIRSDATYLLIGGLGGFGIETARWLVGRGARHVVLNSRSGAVSESAAAAIAEMREAGATVEVFAGDAAERPVLEALLHQIDRTMPPLRGVFHTAMVLDDALFSNLDRARFEAVLRPKVAGAANLDVLTRARALDHFVLYSSATTLVGNPGQANYVAANAALEQIAARRRQAGLPGLAIAWGAISDAGYLARNTAVRNVLSDRLGKDALTAREALEGLGWAMSTDHAAIAYARMDWAQAIRELPIMGASTLSGVAATVERTAADQVAGGDLSKMIAGMNPAEATRAVIELLAGELSRILRLPAESIDPERPLTAIGMDSLMALELRMAAEEKLGIDIPLLALANGATLDEIARRVVEQITSGRVDDTDAADRVILEQHMKVVGDEATAMISELEERAGAVRKLSR